MSNESCPNSEIRTRSSPCRVRRAEPCAGAVVLVLSAAVLAIRLVIGAMSNDRGIGRAAICLPARLYGRCGNRAGLRIESLHRVILEVACYENRQR